MKFVLNHEGILEPVKESKVKEVVVRYAKPVFKVILFGAALYVGFHALQLFLTAGMPGLNFALHELMQMVGLGDYFNHAIHIVSQAKSF